jgi:hypothetical protein
MIEIIVIRVKPAASASPAPRGSPTAITTERFPRVRTPATYEAPYSLAESLHFWTLERPKVQTFSIFRQSERAKRARGRRPMWRHHGRIGA